MRTAAHPSPSRQRSRSAPAKHSILQQAKWASARLLFFAYIGFSLGTLGIGGFLTGPLMTWYFYGDWRFWRHWRSARNLLPHGYRMLYYVLRGDNDGFMLDVALTAPPYSAANQEQVELQKSWEFGLACGPCTRCCSKLHCPVLDEERGLCRGYDAFFWQYFNCGRYPTAQREIDYYLCNKWQFREPQDGGHSLPQPGLAPEPEEVLA